MAKGKAVKMEGRGAQSIVAVAVAVAVTGPWSTERSGSSSSRAVEHRA